MITTYNGYRNHETWAVVVHLLNDMPCYYSVRGDNAEQIEDFVPGNYHLYKEFADLTSETQLNKVDWSEVAEALND